MEEILTDILQGEDASSLYDKYIDFLVTSGYVDYDGVPQKCPICGSKHLVEDNVEVGGFNIPGCSNKSNKRINEKICEKE